MSRYFHTAYLAKRLGKTVEETWDFFESWRLDRPDVIERLGRSWWRFTEVVATRDAPAMSVAFDFDTRPRCAVPDCRKLLPENENGRRRKYCPGGACRQKALRLRNGQRKGRL